MGGQLQTLQDFKPALFVAKEVKLTYAQSLIYELLVTNAEQNKPVSKEDIDRIFAIYQSHYYKNTQMVWIRCWHKGEFQRMRFTIEQAQNRSYITDRSMPWFKHNLASCILKGKIIALPIINIEYVKST